MSGGPLNITGPPGLGVVYDVIVYKSIVSYTIGNSTINIIPMEGVWLEL